MKLKDIKVGEEYAIGAPNVTYNKWSRNRGRVVKVGVHGFVSGSGFHSGFLSEKPTYVEFEPVGCYSSSYGYTFKVIDDPSMPGGERLPNRYKKDNPGDARKVHRCLGTHVLMPWSEYEEQLAEHKKLEVEADKKREKDRDRREGIFGRLKAIGITAFHQYGSIAISLDDLEQILDRLEGER